MQVTSDGDMVFELDSPHKKPYEILMIGRKQSPPTSNQTISAPPTSNQTSSAPPTSNQTIDALPTSNQTTSAPPTSNQTIDALPTSNQTTSASPISNQTSSAPPTSNQTIDALPTSNQTSYNIETALDISSASWSSSYPAIPERYVFMCVPSKVHSQKPFIGGKVTDMYVCYKLMSGCDRVCRPTEAVH